MVENYVTAHFTELVEIIQIKYCSWIWSLLVDYSVAAPPMSALMSDYTFFAGYIKALPKKSIILKPRTTCHYQEYVAAE